MYRCHILPLLHLRCDDGDDHSGSDHLRVHGNGILLHVHDDGDDVRLLHDGVRAHVNVRVRDGVRVHAHDDVHDVLLLLPHVC